MNLHDAIVQVLKGQKRPLTASEISKEINDKSWHTKKDGSDIMRNQIAACIKNYPDLFNQSDGLIFLKSISGNVPVKSAKKGSKKTIINLQEDTGLLKKVLMNEKNFKTISECEQDIPDSPGLYCVRIKDSKKLADVFSNVLSHRNHTIMYIGVASESLRKCFLDQELKAKDHGTFFRTIGAVLGYLPEVGSLIGEVNQNNYKFSPENEQEIVKWIEEHLIFNWIAATSTNLNAIEDQLIEENLPLLNLAGNPGVLNNVRVLRNKCKKIARGNG